MGAIDVKSFYEDFGQRVRAARDKAGLTQVQLADRIGLTRSSVANLEGGRQKILLHILLAIADVLDVEPMDLLPVQNRQDELDFLKLDEETSQLQPGDREFVMSAIRAGVSKDTEK